jgi:hypothetical protein
MSVDYDKLIRALKSTLPAQRLGLLARSVAFVHRLRILRAGTFLWAVVLSRFSHGRPGFQEARSWYHRLSGKWLAPRAFQLRFKTRSAVDYFSSVFDKVVAPWRAATARRASHPLAKAFSDVVLLDATVMQLANELRPHFPGLRGIAAGLKVSLAVSLHGLVPLLAKLTAATQHDMTLFPELSRFRKGTLFLFDLGYVAYERLASIAKATHFYVCRLRVNGNPRIVNVRHAPPNVRRALRRNPDGVCLREVLPRGKKISKRWDVDVLLRPNEQRTQLVCARLVIVPGPKNAQRAYLTNLHSAWTASTLVEIYRLRWQIELVFKELKQNLNLEQLPTKDPNAVQVFVWASLIALAISRVVLDCFHAVQSLLGLAAPLRPPLLTRALRACIRLLACVLVAPAQKAAFAATLLAEQLLQESQTLARHRDDSLSRLATALPMPTTP